MNIFATYPCPIQSANFMDNKRMVKMILESAQLLSGALRFHGVDDDRLYKPTHINHPVAIWTRKNYSNYNWLLQHFGALCERYHQTYGKIHKCRSMTGLFITHAPSMPDGEQTPFENCAANKSLGFDFKHIDDVHEAYRQYLKARWVTDKSPPKFN